MRKRIAIILMLLAAAAALLAGLASPAEARRIPPVIGCDSLLNWPCPGPAL